MFFSHLSQKIGFDISCKLSPEETVCMKCQNLFNGKNIYKYHLLDFNPACRALKILTADAADFFLTIACKSRALSISF